MVTILVLTKLNHNNFMKKEELSVVGITCEGGWGH